MNPTKPTPRLLLALVLAGAWAGGGAGDAAPDETVRFAIVSSPDVRVTGSSTLHDWECVGNRLTLSAQLDLTEEQFRQAVENAWSGELPLPAEFRDEGEENHRLLLAEVPIEALKCTRERMQRDLRETIRFNEHPVIKYELKSILAASIVEQSEPALKLKVAGDLMVAGVTREIEHEVEIRRNGARGFVIRGELNLKMNWFDMEPPTAFFGLLKAHDDFQVKFDFEAEIDRR